MTSNFNKNCLNYNYINNFSSIHKYLLENDNNNLDYNNYDNF